MAPVPGTAFSFDPSRRIARNRRRTVLVFAACVAALAPFVLLLAYGTSASVLSFSGQGTATLSRQVRSEESYVNWLRARGETDATLERDLDGKRELLLSRRRTGASEEMKLIPIFTAAYAAIIGLLVWVFASSPALNLLAEVAAMPAGASDEAAVRRLQEVSARWGVAPPKLYVIPSAAPGLLASGSSLANALIAVTRGTLDLLDERELDAVLAHALSHIVYQETRLNGTVASVSLFLRFPFRFFRSQLSWANRYGPGIRRKLFLLTFALSPMGLYCFCVAPLLGFVIRAIVSRDGEFMADADAVLMTHDPAALVSVLGRIGAATASVPGSHPALAHSCFANPGSLWLSFEARPRLTARIDRMVQTHGSACASGLQQAIEQGKDYGRRHPSMNLDTSGSPAGGDLAPITHGNVMGRVYRLASDTPVPIYETSRPGSLVIGNIQPNALVVAFDDPGVLRQVNTATEQFGYISRTAVLQKVDGVLPQEIYDRTARDAAEQMLAQKAPHAASGATLTSRQLSIAIGFGAAVFLIVLLILLWLR